MVAYQRAGSVESTSSSIFSFSPTKHYNNGLDDGMLPHNRCELFVG